MTTEMYEILSLLARYFFAGLMVLIVYRGWRITVKDNRRAKVLRDWSPETGCVGQLVIGAGGKAQDLVPVPREGVLGASRKADIPVRGKGVLPEHAHVEAREGGLLIRPLGKGQVALGKGDVTGEQLFAQDGDLLTIGEVKALVVMFDPGGKPLVPVDPGGGETEAGAPSRPVRTAGRRPADKRKGSAAPAPAAAPPKTAAADKKPSQALKAHVTIRRAKEQLEEPLVTPQPGKAKRPAARTTKPVPRSQDEIDFFDEDAIWREPKGKSKRRS